VTPSQVTLIGAFGGALLGAVIGGVVSFIVARFTVRHTANYSDQIETINQALASLADTQEQMKQHYAESLANEQKRQEAADRRAEAVSWKPSARIFAVNEGREHVNKLSIDSTNEFIVREIFLLSETGARIYKFLQRWTDPVVAQNVPIPHPALNDLANRSHSYGQSGTFEGAIQYTVERIGGDPILYTGEVRFRATTTMLGSTQWFDLVG
jgi:hypothetical protein